MKSCGNQRTSVRLGIWRDKIDAWVADGVYPSISDAVRAALDKMDHYPISPKTMVRLEYIARGLGLSVDAYVVHMLDIRHRHIR